uniref:Uncharacterized protein n=1 Tax=Monopterus albus TaxID=43700 RepID=A0A3Q3JF50_MONAL
MMDAKLNAAKTEILGGFEKYVESAKGQCGDVRRQCQREQSERQEQMEGAQLSDLKATETCCGTVSGLVEKVHLLETSVAGFKGDLRVELGGHKDHIEVMLAGRLGYVEIDNNVETNYLQFAKYNLRCKVLEGHLLMALEELGNPSTPSRLESHAVPTLETHLEVQKHLNSLEILCSSSRSATHKPSATQADWAAPSAKLAEEQNMKEALDMQRDCLNSLSVTLQNILRHLAPREQQGATEGELKFLKFNIIVHQVGQPNSTWHEREACLAQQIKGVVQLVGHQASMLGAGQHRMTQLRIELQEMKTQLVEKVGSVDDQCKGLNYLAEDLERIREGGVGETINQIILSQSEAEKLVHAFERAREIIFLPYLLLSTGSL